MAKKYSDIELLELLEANGYKASAENCILLKEGLASGRYLIEEDESDVEEAEEKKEKEPETAEKEIEKEDTKEEEKADEAKDSDEKNSDDEKKDDKEDEKEVVEEAVSDYALYKLLESSGYATTKNNLRMLKEGIGSGKFVITEACAKTKATKAKKAKDEAAPNKEKGKKPVIKIKKKSK